MIEIHHLKKIYQSVTPLKDVNTTINDGDIISVIGPSGCGKSTFLRMINLLEKPSSGQIIVNGIDITAPKCKVNEVRKKIGMVFQSFNLFNHLSVIENVMIPPMDLLGISKQEAYDKAMNLLKKVGMENKALEYPDMLSGGQKQRAAIARTLAMDPDVILFDEPTSALDPTMVTEVESVIKDLAKENITMMIVTHDMKFAKEIGNRVFYLDESGIYEEGTPEQIFDNPSKPKTRAFIKHLRVFETIIDNKEYDFKGIMTELSAYGSKNQLDYKHVYNLESIFEELCQQVLLIHNPDYKIHFVVEYNEKQESIKIDVDYNGDLYNPLDSDNELSLSIIKSKVDSIEYSTITDSEYRNKVVMYLKK